jgi:hypothetical protein
LLDKAVFRLEEEPYVSIDSSDGCSLKSTFNPFDHKVVVICANVYEVLQMAIGFS